MGGRRRKQRVTWTDWFKLAFLISVVVAPSLFVGVMVATGEWFGRDISPSLVVTTTTSTTTTAPSN